MTPEEVNFPRIIAEQGEERFLLLYENNQGRILELQAGVLFPAMHVYALLAKGYWDEYKGNHDVQDLLNGITMIEK
jgi:hypothetical protein